MQRFVTTSTRSLSIDPKFDSSQLEQAFEIIRGCLEQYTFLQLAFPEEDIRGELPGSPSEIELINNGGVLEYSNSSGFGRVHTLKARLFLRRGELGPRLEVSLDIVSPEGLFRYTPQDSKRVKRVRQALRTALDLLYPDQFQHR